MQTISVSELQQNLSLYLKKVKDGDEIVIEDKKKAIARILPYEAKDEESRLVENGLMRLPKRQLPEDFWDAPMAEIPLENIVEAVRAERDED